MIHGNRVFSLENVANSVASARQGGDMRCIRYASGYEYQLRETCLIDVPELKGAPRITAQWYSIYDGTMLVCAGYAWDGPSGPAIDTQNFMRGSLAHDVAYQALREGHLPPEYRKAADEMLRRICREDGMSAIRAWWVYTALRFGGGPAADPASIEPDRCAPGGCTDCPGSSMGEPVTS